MINCESCGKEAEVSLIHTDEDGHFYVCEECRKEYSEKLYHTYPLEPHSTHLTADCYYCGATVQLDKGGVFLGHINKETIYYVCEECQNPDKLLNFRQLGRDFNFEGETDS